MAQLDKFFQFLSQPGMRELRLATGSTPVFLTEDGPRPASSARPSPEQLMALLSEVIPAEAMENLRQTGAAGAEIQRPGLPPILARLQLQGSLIEASFSTEALPPSTSGTIAVGSPAPNLAAQTGSTRIRSVPVSTLPASAAPTATGTFSTSPATPSISLAARSGEGKPIDRLFRIMIDRKASDLHVSSGDKPILRVDGDIVRIEDYPVLSPDQVAELLAPITPEANAEEFSKTNDTDFAYEIAGAARFRCNVFTDRKGPGAVFRIIPSKILTAEQLGLSSHILELCKLTKGLVLVTGPTGSGKSTTLTAMIDYINSARSDHIITIEDPIEFVHENRNCLVNQREVHTHTSSFKRALRAALREDPDIVLVGEMRDLETIAIAIETAETGHLVFGTLHTTTAVSTVDRIIDQFPPEQQAQIRTMLSECLKGVIAQVLCKKVGGGRVAALEVLMGIPSVSNLIREGKTFQIPSIMQTGRKYGMVTLNEALVDLVKKGLITAEEAQLRAVDKAGIAAQLRAKGE